MHGVEWGKIQRIMYVASPHTQFKGLPITIVRRQLSDYHFPGHCFQQQPQCLLQAESPGIGQPQPDQNHGGRQESLRVEVWHLQRQRM